MTQGRSNALRGNRFERAVLEELNAPKGTNAVAEIGTKTTTIPDLPVGRRFGVTDIKDVRRVSFGKQLRSQRAAAQTAGLPQNLIVSPRTVKISQPLRRAIFQSGGKIFQFDPVTRKFTELTSANFRRGSAKVFR